MSQTEDQLDSGGGKTDLDRAPRKTVLEVL